jgi:fatty-acyl-CoA synthase
MNGPDDEGQPIALSYTSGTTGNPKGVVTHHRGAYLNAVANVLAWSVPARPVYLWVLAMFHCDGWCFPSTITHQTGTRVCMRKVDPALIFALCEMERVTHMCAAPVVLSMLATEAQANRRTFAGPIDILTAGAPAAASIIGSIESINARVTQVYGLTETYASTTISAWSSEWDNLPAEERYRRKARQGVQYPCCEELEVIDAAGNRVPWDGATLGEVVVCGNTVMAGYLDNLLATNEVFAQGWFHTGDLGTHDEEGYMSVKDRTKDMINSGGEKISSIEIEEVLFEHPDLLEGTVVAAPHEKWGEVPWAFVLAKPGALLSEEDLLLHCSERLAKSRYRSALCSACSKERPPVKFRNTSCGRSQSKPRCGSR